MSVIIDGTAGITFPSGSGTQAAQSKVLQVVQNVYSTQTNNSTNTYADSGLTASITPLFTTSKILIQVTGLAYKTAGNATNGLFMNLCRNGSQIIQFTDSFLYTGTSLDLLSMYGFNYLDSPASTSSTVYKMQFRNIVSASFVQVQASNTNSTITLMEIAA